MAGEDQNQNQNSPGNTAEARTETGELKDQNSTQQSGPNETSTDQSQQQSKPDGKSFLNTKPAEVKPEDADKSKADPKLEGKKDTDASSGAPEKYEAFKLPEGYEFDPDALKEVSGIFKDLGLNQDAAQKLVDYYAKNGLQAANAPYELWADTQKSWVDEIQNRFGSKSESMRTDINKAIDVAITSPKLRGAFREALDLTGAGSNPDFVEAFSIFAKPFLEGTPVVPGKVSNEANKPPQQPQPPSAAEAIYPHLIQNRGAQ